MSVRRLRQLRLYNIDSIYRNIRLMHDAQNPFLPYLNSILKMLFYVTRNTLEITTFFVNLFPIHAHQNFAKLVSFYSSIDVS